MKDGLTLYAERAKKKYEKKKKKNKDEKLIEEAINRNQKNLQKSREEFYLR